MLFVKKPYANTQQPTANMGSNYYSDSLHMIEVVAEEESEIVPNQ